MEVVAMQETRKRPKRLAELTVGEVARVIGAEAPMVGAERPWPGVGTDSRAVRPGEVFLALRGENFDAHDFAAGAVEAGAGGLIVRRDFARDLDGRVPVLRVDDPLAAYGELGRYEREAWGGPVIAISGSAGKTATRRMVAGALARRRRVLEPVKNFNNLIGLPHTLLRLEPAHEVAVLELGMNLPGELARLTEIARPDVAGLTQVGMAHVGMLGSVEALVEAKFDLFRGCEPGVPLVVNAGCPRSGRAAIERFGREHPMITFRADGGGEADVAVENVRSIRPVGYRFDLVVRGRRFPDIELRHFGRHLLEDAAAAAGLMLAAGETVAGPVEEWAADLAETLRDFQTEAMRGQVIRAGDWTFIVDCYNAAPEAMTAALKSLADVERDGRLVLVLSEMGELGDFTEEAHARMEAPIRALKPDLLLTLGDQMGRVAERLCADGIEAEAFADRDALTDALRARLQPGDLVFFKGARRFALENVVKKLAPDLKLDK